MIKKPLYERFSFIFLTDIITYMKNFISKSFLPEQSEEDPEPKHHKHKYVPIDEVHDQADDSWKRYGEGLSAHSNADIYVGELEDDRVSLENTEQKKSAFYFEGHYLDMDDPYDRAFYNAKKAESEEKEKIEEEIKPDDNLSEMDKIEASHLDLLRQPLAPNSGNDGWREKVRHHSKRLENLKTLNKSDPKKIERAYRGELAKSKQDLVFGDMKDKEKYIDRETLYQDNISDFLDTHHKELEDTFEESDNKYNSW